MALAKAMQPLGQVTILGPDRNWPDGGHVKTIHRPLRTQEIQLSDDLRAYVSDGAPSDCVALALMGFIEERVDLVVSGINPTTGLVVRYRREFQMTVRTLALFPRAKSLLPRCVWT